MCRKDGILPQGGLLRTIEERSRRLTFPREVDMEMVMVIIDDGLVCVHPVIAQDEIGEKVICYFGTDDSWNMIDPANEFCFADCVHLGFAVAERCTRL